MKAYLSLLLVLCSCYTGWAQCNYVTKRFGFVKESDVVYGVSNNFTGRADTLKMDIYKPVGDDNPLRPVILFIHGGGFHAGNKASFTKQCEWYASRGYVAATMSYRLGFYRPLLPDAYPYVYDSHEFHRAIYRATQDGFGAVRFLKGRAQQDSTDKDNFFLAGSSAGGITALHVAFGHHDSLKRASNGSIAKVVRGFDQFARPDLGSFFGDQNLNGNSVQVKGVVNLFGALSDTTWVHDKHGPAVYSYHQTGDPVVACGAARPYTGLGLGMPERYGLLYGSCSVHEQMDRMNYEAEKSAFYKQNGNGHDVHNPILIDSLSAVFLENLICTSNGAVDNERFTSFPVNLHPNPVENHLSFSSAAPIDEVVVLDYCGREVITDTFNSTLSGRIDLSDLSKGLYSIRLFSDNGQISSKSILKK